MNKIIDASERQTARPVTPECVQRRQSETMRKALKRLSAKAAAQAPGRKLRLPAVRHG